MDETCAWPSKNWYAGILRWVVWKVSTVYHGLNEWEGEECHRWPEEFLFGEQEWKNVELVGGTKFNRTTILAFLHRLQGRFKGTRLAFYCTFNLNCQYSRFPSPSIRGKGADETLASLIGAADRVVILRGSSNRVYARHTQGPTTVLLSRG